jgi:DNA-directed RNA polymerase specialized sigma24 family protein
MMVMAERSDGSYFQTYVVLRCNRWGAYVRWVKDHQTMWPGPGDPRSWWGPLILDRNVPHRDRVSLADVLPTWLDVEEALETDRCVKALPYHLRDTCVREYVHSGDRRDKAAALGIETRTFRYRLVSAHALLLGLFNDAAAGCLE